MSEPIGPGDWVECIDDSPGLNPPGAKPLVRGALYRIEKIVPTSICDCFLLVGLRVTGKRGKPMVFSNWRFRPVRDGQERIVKPEKVTA